AALVLAEDAGGLVRERHVGLPDQLADALLVLGMAKAPQEADRGGFELEPLEPRLEGVLVERPEHAVRPRPLRHRDPQLRQRRAGAKPFATYAATTSNSSSRCLCDGQYLLPGSGIRWHAVPLRVLAWQQSGLPSKVTPSRACWSTYSLASST